jgi:hypothetical protein
MLLTKETAEYENGIYKWTFPKQSFKWIFKKLTSSQDKKMVYGIAYPNGIDSYVLIETNKQQDTIIEMEYIDKTEFLFSVKDGFPIGIIFEDVIDIEIELFEPVEEKVEEKV